MYCKQNNIEINPTPKSQGLKNKRYSGSHEDI